MDGMDAGVLDAPEVDSEIGGPEDEAIEAEGIDNADPEGGPEGQPKDDPYTTRGGREHRAAMRAMAAAHPEYAKFLNEEKSNYARMFALMQLEPKGIDGVRERYALLDSLSHGETKGPEAVTAMQERLASIDEVDQAFLNGDVKALEAFDESFNPGLAKLAGPILDRVRQSDPNAYTAAILPHVVESLKSSELVQNFNGMVDKLNEQPPTWLTPDQKQQWAAEKMKSVIGFVGGMGNWLNSTQEKAGSLSEVKPGQEQDKFQQERQQFEQEKQQQHWDTSIKPVTVAHENAKFEELLKPYNLRLKLDAGAKADLQQSFKAALNRAGTSDAEYQRQMKIYRAQKNPDATAVTNFVKNAINKHSKTVMEGLIKARYSSFLNGKTAQPQTKPGGQQAPPVAPNIEIRSVKPPMHEIDHRNTTVEQLAQKIYRLTNGKLIQVRAA